MDHIQILQTQILTNRFLVFHGNVESLERIKTRRILKTGHLAIVYLCTLVMFKSMSIQTHDIACIEDF